MTLPAIRNPSFTARVFPMGPVLNPALTWEHPDLAVGATRSAAYHAEDWRGFSNVPFWCLMGENLFAEKAGDFSEAHRRHFAAWLKRRYGSAETWAKAWRLEHPRPFADAPAPTAAASEDPGPAELDMARFRRESMAELHRAVRAALRGADPHRPALGRWEEVCELDAVVVKPLFRRREAGGETRTCLSFRSTDPTTPQPSHP